MAATANKYSAETLNDKDTTSGQTTTKNIYVLQPLALTEYTSDANFKQMFFCHDVWHKKDGDGNEVVIGLLDTRAGISNSHYQTLHADARKGKLRLVKGGVDYTVLNDGGLNTKPFADTPTIDMCCENLVIFHFSYQNAYWENTSNAVATIEVWRNNTKQAERTLTLSDMPKVRATSSDVNGPCYILDQDTMNALSPSEGDTIKIKVSVTNGEGTYSTGEYATATVDARIELLIVRKITAVSDNPADGDLYHCLIKPEYWDTVVNGDDGYPNLKNLFAAAEDTRVNTTVYFRGFSGNSAPSNLLDSALPAGLYYGFPATTPFVDVDPPAANKIIEVEDTGDGGHAFKWHASTYTPVVPVVPLTFSGFTAAFSTTGTYTSYATVANNYYDVHIWPTITVSASAAGSGSFTVQLVWIEDGNDYTEVVVWSKSVSVEFSAAGTQTIPLSANSETQGGEGVPVSEIGCIDTSFTSRVGQYDYRYRLQITAIDENSSLSGVTLPVESTEILVDDFIIS